MTNNGWLISVDDHVIEPPDLWTKRVSSRYRDEAPRVVTDDNGGEAWLINGDLVPVYGLMTAAGRPRELVGPEPVPYSEMPPAYYDSAARVEVLNTDRVLASLCFPSVPRFCGQIFSESADRGLGLECLRVYNDWQIDEWAGAAPGRYIPVMAIPLWDRDLAVAEIKRCADKGVKALLFPENPVPLGYPSLFSKDGFWDPVLAAAQDADLPLCSHIGSSSNVMRTAPDAPMIMGNALAPMNALFCCTDWILSGTLSRFPDLKIVLSEGGIGWIPYILERLEFSYESQRSWASKSDYSWDLGDDAVLSPDKAAGVVAIDRGLATLDLDLSPHDVFREHLYGCFIDDEYGSANLDAVGIDNVMVETDYPHTASRYPDSMDVLMKQLSGRSEDEIDKILVGNARRVFNLDTTSYPIPNV